MVTPDLIAVELGRPLPLDDTTHAQWQSWIDRTERMIQRRLTLAGVEAPDTETVDDVVLLAVAAHAKNPEGVDTVDVSVDDGRESRRYRAGSDSITITDEWWAWLLPAAGMAGLGTIQPSFEPDTAESLLGWV